MGKLRDQFYQFIGVAVSKEHQVRAQQLLDAVAFKDEVGLVTNRAVVSGTYNDNPALHSLLAALANLGIIVDNTTET